MQHDPDPPLPFDAGHFDMVYGLSVFTHLARDRQLRWLAELRRLLRPGGIAVVTTHGLPAFFASVNIGWMLYYLLRDGFSVFGANNDLDDGLERSRERTSLNVWHTAAYIYAAWSEFFEIVRFIPAGVYAQDYVVLRRRPE